MRENQLRAIIDFREFYFYLKFKRILKKALESQTATLDSKWLRSFSSNCIFELASWNQISVLFRRRCVYDDSTRRDTAEPWTRPLRVILTPGRDGLENCNSSVSFGSSALRAMFYLSFDRQRGWPNPLYSCLLNVCSIEIYHT